MHDFVTPFTPGCQTTKENSRTQMSLIPAFYTVNYCKGDVQEFLCGRFVPYSEHQFHKQGRSNTDSGKETRQIYKANKGKTQK